MATLSHPSTVSQKVSSFLDGKVRICSPNNPYLQKSIVIRDFVHAILSGIEASPEIQEACTSIEAVFTGSYLANKAVSLHPIVNDKDIKIHFRLKDQKMQYTLYHKVRLIAAKYLIDQLGDSCHLKPTDSLLALGVKKDHSTIVKNLRLGFLELEGAPGDLPLEISMVFTDKPYLTHLSSVDSLEVPVKVCGNDLGSEQTPGQFIIRSKEGENLEEILSDLRCKKITSSKVDWDPNLVNYFELGRYFIWICEQCTEKGSAVFSCFYHGSIAKNPPRALWENLHSLVKGKRPTFVQYPFFLFCNFLFHAPSIEASSWLLEMQDVFDSLVSQMPKAHFLKQVLYTKENRLKPNALFLLSCHIPLLAEKVVCVDHLGRKHLQCHFSEQGIEFTILVPIPFVEEGLASWLRELLLDKSSSERIWQILSFALSDDQHEDLLSVWRNYKAFLADEQQIQDLMHDLFISENERFFEILSLDGEVDFVYDALEKVFSQLHEVSQVFQEKYKLFPKSEKLICQWLVSLLPKAEDRFFSALSFVLTILPPERAGSFIRNRLLAHLLSERRDLSPTFVKRYKDLMGTDEEIQLFLQSLLPLQKEAFFIEAFAFVCRDLLPERQKVLACEILEKNRIYLKKSPSLWSKYKAFLGDESEFQDFLQDLYVKEEEMFFKILSLDQDPDFVYGTLQRFSPSLNMMSEPFQKKYKSFFENTEMLCSWMIALLDKGDDHFFEALSFVSAMLPQRKAENFIRNSLLIALLDKKHVFSQTFIEKYKVHMGSEEEIQDFLLSLLPAQEERFFQALSFMLKGISIEKQKSFASQVIEMAIPLMNKTSSIWEKCRPLLGEDQEIQDWMLRLFTRNERLFIQALSLEKNGVFVCEILRQVLPLIHTASESFSTSLEPILQQHVTAAKSWQTICIRCIMDSLLGPKCLRILARKSGVVQKGKVAIQGTHFPKLLPVKEKEKFFSLKIALLFMDSSYILDTLQEEMSEEGLQECRKSFSHSDTLRPIFKDLIDKGLIHEATSFLEGQKRVWGIKGVLAWYEQLFQRTNFSSAEALCKKSVEEALSLRINPWSCYATFASMPSILPLVEPHLTLDPVDLPIEEKAACLNPLLSRIPLLIQASDIDTAYRLATYLSFFSSKEEQVAPIFLTLFEKVSTREAREKIAFLMYRSAPCVAKDLMEYFKRPYSLKKEQIPVRSSFPINQWVMAILTQVQDPLYFPLLVEQLEKLVSISAPELLTIVQKYVPHLSEEEKEKLALAAVHLPASKKSIGQEIFAYAAPSSFSRTAPLMKIWNFIKGEAFLMERRAQIVDLALARIPNYLAEASFFAEIFPDMALASKERFCQKSVIEIRSLLEDWGLFMQGSCKNKVRPSLSVLTEEPFISMICQSVPLYEMLISLFHAHMQGLTAKEGQIVFKVLEQGSLELPVELQRKRVEVLFFCMKRLKAFSLPSWLAKDVSEDLSLQEEFQKMSISQSSAPAIFLQGIGSQLEKKPKDPAFYNFFRQQIQAAHCVDGKTLEALIGWMKSHESIPMEEEIFQIGKELLFLCIRSNKNLFVEDLLTHLYQDLRGDLSIEMFLERQLAITSELTKQNPVFVKSAHVQKLAKWIAHQSTLVDDPKMVEATNRLIELCLKRKSSELNILQDCLFYLLPPLDPSSDSLNHLVLLYKNYLSALKRLPVKDCKGIDFSFLAPLEQYLLKMRSRFTGECFACCSVDVLTLYMHAGQSLKAKTWMDRWMSEQEASLDNVETVRKFYCHQWAFLRFLARDYPGLVDKSHILRSVKYLQSVEEFLDNFLSSEYKTDVIEMCSSVNQPEFTKDILRTLCPTLDATCDNALNLRKLFADYISVLLVTCKDSNVHLGEDFFEPIMTYLLAMKEKMPLLEEVYICLQAMSMLSSKDRYKIGDILDALCPPLALDVPDAQSLDVLSLLDAYYMPILLIMARDCDSCINQEKLGVLVEYVIHMQEKEIFPGIEKLSRNLLAVCAQCQRVDLATSLIEKVHKKRMLQFYEEKKDIDISEDLGSFLSYLIIPGRVAQDQILSTRQLIAILREHKTRGGTNEVRSFDSIIDIFTKQVRKIQEGGRANAALFHLVSMVAIDLLENEPISAHVIELIYCAYNCPWADFCFHTFLNVYRTLQMKMQQQGLTYETLPGTSYVISMEKMISRVCENFHSSSFSIGSRTLSFAIRDFIFFFYTFYRKTREPTNYFLLNGLLVQALEKIVREKPSWLYPTIGYIYLNFSDCLLDFKRFIRESTLIDKKKEEIISTITVNPAFLFSNVQNILST